MRGLINLLIVFLTTIGFGQVSDFSTWASYVPEKKKREITEVEREAKKKARELKQKNFKLVIERSTIKSEEETSIVGVKIANFDASSKLVLDKDYLLDPKWVASLGIDPAYVRIPKGEYEMTVDNQWIAIRFMVEKPEM